jgi:TATA-box binding protein (TBP) (component of TFIID and TFIIIB)
MKINYKKINSIGTMVCLGRIFFDISTKDAVNLKLFASKIKCNNIIKYVDLWEKDENGIYNHYYNGILPKKNTKKERNKKEIPFKIVNGLKKEINNTKKNVKKGFANSFSHDINYDGKSARCTIFSNGKLLISGLKSEDQREKIFILLNNIYKKIEKDNIIIKIFSNSINVQHERYVLIQHTLTIDNNKHDLLMIDNLKLLKFLRSENKNYSYYEPKEVRSLELINKKISYMIFQKGTINVTGINKLEDIKNSIDYITNFIGTNINSFNMEDIVLKTINLIKEDKNSPDQKSKEWLLARHSAVTASEFAPIVGMGYKGKKMSSYIKEKVKRIKGENKFTGNIYTRKGEIYEQIALHCYSKMINSNPKRKYFIFIKEVGLVKHKINSFIGASADGVVFMVSCDLKNINYDLDPSIEQIIEWYKKDLIIGVHLIEIKCPSKYNIYNSIKCHGCKCVDIGKDTSGYHHFVRNEYWCQMQQQCYVWNEITMNVMSNNNFIEFESRKDFLNDKTNKYKGVLLKVWGIDKESSYLPVAIFPKKTIIENVFHMDINKKLDNIINELYLELWKKYNNELIDNKIYKVSIIYWIQEHVVNTEVPFEKEWYKSKIPEIKKCMEVINNSLKEHDDINNKLKFILDNEDPLSDCDELSDNDSQVI